MKEKSFPGEDLAMHFGKIHQSTLSLLPQGPLSSLVPFSFKSEQFPRAMVDSGLEFWARELWLLCLAGLPG